MAYIKRGEDVNGETVFPVTHDRAVINDNGTNLETRLQEIDDNVTTYDVSYHNGGQMYSLSGAIAATPDEYKHAGIKLRFISDITSGYTEYACIGSAFTENVSGWANVDQFNTGEYVGNVGIDEEPTANSENLVKSGGVKANLSEAKKNVIDVINEGVTNPFVVDGSTREGGSYGAAYSPGGVANLTPSTTVFYYLIPISDFCGFKISVDYCIQYGFVEKQYEEGGTKYIKYCAGCNRVTGIPSEETIPYDAEYLYIYVGSSTGNRTVTIKGLPTTNLKDIEEELDAHGDRISAVEEAVGSIDDIESDLEELNHDLFGTPVFSNVEISGTGKITFTPIVLSQDGDELEVITTPDASVTNLQNGGYAFTFGSSEDSIRLGRSLLGGIAFRGDDNTWIFSAGTGAAQHIKIKYNNGNIELYSNDTLTNTYTGQKTVTIYGIGSQTSSYGRWKGSISKFDYTHNGVKTSLLDLPGFTKNDGVTINYVSEGGAIPEIEEQLGPNIVVYPQENKVTVYFKLNTHYYGKLDINHTVDNTDEVYKDFWGISYADGGQIGDIATYSNGNFIGIGKKLLVGAENEFAIQFYSSDFTGGVHGDERIDANNGGYVVFIVDGKEYSISELIALGTSIRCDRFGYRQKTDLYTMFQETGTHDVIAHHTKRTEFGDGGYRTYNYIEMAQTMTARNTYSGLVCVDKDIADYVVNNAGTVFTATHPSSSTIISGFSNKTSRKVKMYKGGASCELDSKVVGGNVSAFNSASVNVTIWDRVNDTKYYSVMPQNVELTSTSVFEFECSVKFDYSE